MDGLERQRKNLKMWLVQHIGVSYVVIIIGIEVPEGMVRKTSGFGGR